MLAAGKVIGLYCAHGATTVSSWGLREHKTDHLTRGLSTHPFQHFLIRLFNLAHIFPEPVLVHRIGRCQEKSHRPEPAYCETRRTPV